MSKSIRTFSVLARPVTQSRRFARSQHSILRRSGQVSVQPVRFRNPPFRYGRIVRFAAQSALTCYLVYLVNKYVLGHEEEDEPHAETTTPSIVVATNRIAEEAEQVEEVLGQLPTKLPEDAIFIPLWWGKKCPPKFYKRSDPEWQGFVKFANDEKKVKNLRIKLAMHIAETSLRNPHWARFLGAPIRLGRVWLDIEFPIGPPPEYDRPGIEIAENYVALTSRPQSSEHYKQVKSALWPKAISKSVYYSFQTYWSLQLVRFKNYLNLKTEAEEPKQRMSPGPFNLHKMIKTPDKQAPQMNGKLDGLTDPKVISSKATGSGTTDTSSIKPSATGLSSDSAKILSFLPSLKKFEGDLGSAVTKFKQTLLRTWNPPAVIDRGAFTMGGLIEVVGSKAKIVVNVLATFHPETNELKILSLSPQRASPHRLVPPT